MSPITAARCCLSQCPTFSGHARRAEHRWFTLVLMLVAVLARAADAAADDHRSRPAGTLIAHA